MCGWKPTISLIHSPPPPTPVLFGDPTVISQSILETVRIEFSTYPRSRESISQTQHKKASSLSLGTFIGKGTMAVVFRDGEGGGGQVHLLSKRNEQQDNKA